MDIYGLIDRIKGLCHVYGLSNQASEEEIVRNLFLYKLLNDRFSSEKQRSTGGIYMEKRDLIDNAEPYPDWLNEVFQRINTYPENKALCKEGLFTPIIDYVDASDRDAFFKNIKTIFSEAGPIPMEGGDFFGQVFEYLIQDYNVASGRYAEYYTPMEISGIISRILTNDGKDTRDSLQIYDPSAGTGTLLLSLQRRLKQPMLYAQDISHKSMSLLQLNLILNQANGATERANTLATPAFSGPFDYIVSNPPFKTDFSFIRDDLDKSGRFPWGVPVVPVKNNEAMSIYLCFIQHVLQALAPDGKAAIVVPLNFLSTMGAIETAIRRYITENRMIQGILVMPKNTFANTGTKVAIMFLDRSGCDTVAFMDVSEKGHLEKRGNVKRTVLGDDVADDIVKRFLAKTDCAVPIERVNETDCSFLPGRYMDLFADRASIGEKEWEEKQRRYAISLTALMEQETYWNQKLKEVLNFFPENDEEVG